MKDRVERPVSLDTGRYISNGWKKEDKTLSAVVNGQRVYKVHPYALQKVRIVDETLMKSVYDMPVSDIKAPHSYAAQMAATVLVTKIHPKLKQWAFNRLVVKTNSATELMLLVDVAEMHKTASMLQDYLRDLKDLYLACTKLNARKAKKLADKHATKASRALARKKQLNKPVPLKTSKAQTRIAEEWLKYRYGIAPLMGSIESALAVIVGKGLAKKVNASCRAYTVNFRMDSNSDPTYWNPSIKEFFTGRLRVSYKGWVQITNPNLRQMRDLGLSNPLETIYELIPFSFVLDWLVNVGDYIKNLDPFIGLKFTDMVIVHQAVGASERYAYPRTDPINSRNPPILLSRELVSAKEVVLNDYPQSPSVLLDGGLLSKWRRSVDILTFLQTKIKRH